MKRSAASLPRLFQEVLDRPLQRRVSLRRHSSFRIGGKADYFFAARSSEELKSGLEFANERSLPYYVIGSGTNMLFADEGYRGLILKNEVRGIHRKKGSGRIDVLAGTPLADLVSFALEEGWAGLEFAAGIPGTVGGAVFGNAGAWGCAIGQLLLEAVLLDGQGKEVRVGNEHFEFGYRHSILKKSHLTILQVVLGLCKGDRGRIKAKMEESLAKRKAPCPSPKMAYAGSFFKNPILPDGTKMAAGFLLEKVGAKELRKGKAVVYPGHANFILNCGGATAADIRGLARTMKTRVKKEFGITLEEEIIYLPAGFSMPRTSAV
ncbi:MAG: UDP-N-acetylmuramate dehydrogenase [Candidatus Aminicenantales bacterium]